MGIDIKIPEIRMPSFTNFDFNLMLKLVDGLNLTPNYRLATIKGIKISTRSKKKQEVNEKDNGLVKKVRKSKDKHDKDIVVIIDESEKHKEELDEQMESITIDMDGFEKIHIEQYQKQLEQYKRFLNEYLKEAQYTAKAYDAYQDDKEKDGKRKFEWGQEVVTFREIKDIARRIHMNALLSGNSTGDMSGHNSISWSEGQEYKFWKYASKFNEMMSFIIYDSIGSGG